MEFPFNQKNLSENEFERSFSELVHEDDLQWHWDDRDRVVEPLEETDWMLQFDNQLPQKIEGKITIPKGVYHRLIKGTKDFKVKITEL